MTYDQQEHTKKVSPKINGGAEVPAVGISKNAPAHVFASTCWKAKSAGEIDHERELEPHVTSTVTSVLQATCTEISSIQNVMPMVLTIQVVPFSRATSLLAPWNGLKNCLLDARGHADSSRTSINSRPGVGPRR